MLRVLRFRCGSPAPVRGLCEKGGDVSRLREPIHSGRKGPLGVPGESRRPETVERHSRREAVGVLIDSTVRVYQSAYRCRHDACALKSRRYRARQSQNILGAGKETIWSPKTFL